MLQPRQTMIIFALTQRQQLRLAWKFPGLPHGTCRIVLSVCGTLLNWRSSYCGQGVKITVWQKRPNLIVTRAPKRRGGGQEGVGEK